MLVYKCLITGSELFSDSYPIELVDDLYYKVTGKLTSESGGIDESMIGGNASAEDAVETLEETATTGVNIVLANRLQEIPGLTKKEYMTFFKAYIKKLVEKCQEDKPDEVDALKSRLTQLHKVVGSLWKKEEFQVFQGEVMEEGMYALLGYDDNTPYMIFYKDGLIEEKF